MRLFFGILLSLLVLTQAQFNIKAGTCPSATGPGICVQGCNTDFECGGTQKCCSNGCGKTCVDPVTTCATIDCAPGNVCVDSPTGGQCIQNPCATVRCMSGTTCRVTATGTAVCEPTLINPCPTPLYNCLVAPCSTATCSAYPSATCTNNYCGGCNADFYVNGVKVDCASTTGTTPGCNNCANVPRPMIADVQCPDGINTAGYKCNTTRCVYEMVPCPVTPTTSSTSGSCNNCAGVPRPMIADVLCPDGVNSAGYRCNNTRCTYEMVPCPTTSSTTGACNNCAGVPRPLMVDVLCPDGVNSAGYRCNNTRCVYERVPCPVTTCDNCVVSSVCPTSTANRPCGTKTCQMVAGVCVGTLSCADCPVIAPPVTCAPAGCNGDLCLSSTEATNLMTTCVINDGPQCTRLSTCGYNATEGKCAWANTAAYLTCKNGATTTDDCSTRRDLCSCTSNPKCGYCQSSVRLEGGRLVDYGTCMYTENSQRCLSPLSLSGLAGTFSNTPCPVRVNTPVSSLINSVTEQSIQTIISDLVSRDATVKQFNVVLQSVLDPVKVGDKSLVRNLVTVAGTTTPTDTEKRALCKILGSAMEQKLAGFVMVDCTLTKVTDPVTGVKRDVAQTGSASYMNEVTMSPSSSPSTLPVWVYAVIAVGAVVLIAVIIAVALYATGASQNRDSLMEAYRFS